MERYYTNDGKTYAIIEGEHNNKTLFTVYYDGWWAKREFHEIKLYEWAKHSHENAPGGTPYGYIKASKTGQRIIITV